MFPHRIRKTEASKTELQWNMECKKSEHGKPNAKKDGMNQLHDDIVGICKCLQDLDTFSWKATHGLLHMT